MDKNSKESKLLKVKSNEEMKKMVNPIKNHQV